MPAPIVTPRVAVGGVVTRETDGRVEVLLLRRGPDAANGAGEWSLPGGKLDPLETLAQGAARETFEETGVETDEIRSTGRITEDAFWGPDLHFVTHYFHIAEWHGDVRIVEPHKHDGLLWVDAARLRRAADAQDPDLPLFPPTRNFVGDGGLRDIARLG